MSSNGPATPRTMVNSVIRALSSLTSGGRNSQANEESSGGGVQSPYFGAERSVSPEGQTQLGDLDLGARLRLGTPPSEDLEEPLTSARMEMLIGEQEGKKSESPEMSKPTSFWGRSSNDNFPWRALLFFRCICSRWATKREFYSVFLPCKPRIS